ncbi:MAG: trypsin-like peptidase domain-containing protein [Thermoguttaceae bacterium]|nr:trypsin-like peptidase domain-containing protein [Thermoguttaceae bacterium]MDW8036923.1 trypsin-like peptidase domain-containing protein [Thermoguttaceae bacterium]
MNRRVFWAVGWLGLGVGIGMVLMGWAVWTMREKPVAAQEVPPLGFPAPPPVGAAAKQQDQIPNLEESPELAELTPEERVHVWVYELCNRSVVHITTKSIREGALLLFAVEIPAEGEGSGVVLDRRGHILTNCHVVEGAQEIQVTLFNGKSYPGRLVGQDRVTDVAVLRIDAPPEELFPVMFGDSNRLRVGQRVYAIGNPFGFERTLTTGIISSLNRTLPSRSQARTIKNVIQIDAAINPGNSGGPLLDTRGRMIGMNTAIASRTGESAGVGFAIPVNTIARVVPQLIEHGRVRRPDVGILRVYQTDRGLLVAALAPGGAAEKAGIRGPQVIRQRRRQGPLVYEYTTIDRSAADLIVGVDGQKIKNADDFLSLIESKQPGDVVTLNVLRQGRLIEVPVRLEAGE